MSRIIAHRKLLTAGFISIAVLFPLACGSHSYSPPPVSNEPRVVLGSEIEIAPEDLAQIDTKPRMTHFEAPGYPQLAKQAGLEGRVWVKVLISESGTPLKAELHQSSGTAGLDDPVLRAALQCRYLPARRLGAAVPVHVIYAVDFILPLVS